MLNCIHSETGAVLMSTDDDRLQIMVGDVIRLPDGNIYRAVQRAVIVAKMPPGHVVDLAGNDPLICQLEVALRPIELEGVNNANKS